MQSPGFLHYFSSLKDRRVNRRRLHEFEDIISIAILSVICGAEGWEDMQEFGVAKHSWLSRFLALPNGIPSADTFRRVFEMIRPAEFEACFRRWTQELAERVDGVISIDGKQVRGSQNRRNGLAALQVVSAWSQQAQLTLAQCAVDAESNEITAIPRLLKLLDLEGTLITIDAIGTQKEIAQEICTRGGAYVLSLKANQSGMHQQVMEFFADAEQRSYRGEIYQSHRDLSYGHDRIEERYCCVSDDVAWLSEQYAGWSSLKQIAMVHSRVEQGAKVYEQRRYYLSSRVLGAAECLSAVRGHWQIENSVHWVMDVSFGEDSCRIRSRHGAENMSLLRRLAMNLLRSQSDHQRGIKARMKRAGWDHDYLAHILRF